MTGGDCKTKLAGTLLAAPAGLLISTVYWPSWFDRTLNSTSVELVSPGRRLPLKRHWKESVGSPSTETLKVTFDPAGATWLCGCAVIEGGTSAAGPVAEPGVGTP